ncbi:hypothetical protein L915_01573 [Phytophthora nicotianae]|uniref:Uncharacterized protein n=2 Tax=Phytophthora nicotianae TaxID=4792 RepID=V9FY20_PHYNI|nr:hypothetical protein F443_01656 [Phytophthora nicotianae P1569]ETK95495.1 hypothetical protein L915_01573 [Phytophthora nicotianae]
MNEVIDEERGAIDTLRNRLANKASAWLKSKEIVSAKKIETNKLVEYVKQQARSTNLDDAVENLQKKGITHDQMKKWLRLDKEKNQWMSMNRNSPLYNTYTPEYKLFDKLRDAAIIRRRANQ